MIVTDLVVTLLGSGYHPAVLPGAVCHGHGLTPGVAHMLARGALHILGGAGCLLALFSL